MRPFWIIYMSPKYNGKYSVKDRQAEEKTHRRGEDNVETEADTGVIWP